MLKNIIIAISIGLNIFLIVTIFTTDPPTPIYEYEYDCDQGIIMEEEYKETSPLDQQRWGLMKEFMYGAELYYEKNDKYPNTLRELKPYIELPENFEKELEDSFFYEVGPDSEGDQNMCYEISTRFESEYYIDYHDEDGKFSVSNKEIGLCRRP